MNDVEIAESVLKADKADLVTMARASLADPDMPKKILEGREDEVIRCIGCLQGCSGENIVVIGGGLVGAETADMLAEQNKHLKPLFDQ